MSQLLVLVAVERSEELDARRGLIAALSAAFAPPAPVSDSRAATSSAREDLG